MEDFGKIILYALAVGAYYLLNRIRKPGATPPSEAAKPFVSPAAKPEVRPVSPPPARPPSPLGNLLRQLKSEQPAGRPTDPPSNPFPVPENPVRSSAGRSLEGQSLETRPNRRNPQEAGYETEKRAREYANEADGVNYEIPEKAGYQGLDNAGRGRFAEFEQKQPVTNAYADLLKNPQGVRDAFVLGEIFRRKEF